MPDPSPTPRFSPCPIRHPQNKMDDVVLCYVLQRVKRPLFQNLTVYISGARQVRRWSAWKDFHGWYIQAD